MIIQIVSNGTNSHTLTSIFKFNSTTIKRKVNKIKKAGNSIEENWIRTSQQEDLCRLCIVEVIFKTMPT